MSLHILQVSPFADALKFASHVVVVPNSTWIPNFIVNMMIIITSILLVSITFELLIGLLLLLLVSLS